jgi:hypothetical protein
MACAKLFKKMEAHDMPQHLVDHVAKQMHCVFSKDVFQEIHTMYSPFEKLFMESEDVFDSLTQNYPEMNIRVDREFEWVTIVMKLTATKFIVWHEYQEYVEKESILMEGEVKENENTYLFTRFVYMDEGRQPDSYHDVEKYHKKQYKNMIPFHFLHYCMKNEHCMEHNVYKNAENYGKWLMPKKIMDVFDIYLWEWEQLDNDDMY